MDVEIGGFCALPQIRKHEYHGGKEEFGGECLTPSEELHCQGRPHSASSEHMVFGETRRWEKRNSSCALTLHEKC